MNKNELKNEIASMERAVGELTAKLTKARRDLAKIESREFIEANNIKASDVEFSSGDDRPYFGHIRSLAEWLCKHSHKRWCEWNGTIHNTAEICAGKFIPTPGRVADIEGAEKEVGR